MHSCEPKPLGENFVKPSREIQVIVKAAYIYISWLRAERKDAKATPKTQKR